MTTKKTFLLTGDDERKLVYEETQNERGLLVSNIDYQSPEKTSSSRSYDDKDRLILEKEFHDDIEIMRTEFKYDSQGELISRKLFIDDSLFAELNIEEFESERIKKSYQEAELVEQITEAKDGSGHVREFYEDSVLVEKHVMTYDDSALKETREIYDNRNKLYLILEVYYDADKNMIKLEENDSKGNQRKISEFQYKDGLLVFEFNQDFDLNEFSEVMYEYDYNENLVSQEIRTPEGQLLEFQKLGYDDKNRVTFETGFSIGSFSAIYGTYVRGEEYVFEHEYED